MKKKLIERPVLGYSVMNAQKRVLIVIGEDIRRDGLTPAKALDLARLLTDNATEVLNEAARTARG